MENILEVVCRKSAITSEELRQGELCAKWAEESGQNKDLVSFLHKAVGNCLADRVAETMEAERREEYEKRSVICHLE